MDYMFRRWVRLPTVLALVKPKYDHDPVQVRFFTEDEETKKHYPWLEGKFFTLWDTEYNPDGTKKNGELAEFAEKFVAKNISIDRPRLNPVNDCFLIEIKENK